MLDEAALVVVSLMVMVAERLVEALKPLVCPVLRAGAGLLHLDYEWLLMVFSWAVAFALVMLTGANLFAGVIANPLAGCILTAVVAGGGSNLLHAVWPQE